MRTRYGSWLFFLSLVLVLVTGGQSWADLKRVGPVSPVTTLPLWYQDLNDLALQPCLDQNGMCILTPAFDPALGTVLNPMDPITTTGPINNANFPDESFYFLADSTVAIRGGADTATLRMAFESSFLSGVFPNGGITFLRVNLKKLSGLTPNSVYTVTYPYGTFEFTSDSAGEALAGSGAAYRAEDLSTTENYFTMEMQHATHTHIGPFLRRAAGLIVDPLNGHTYLGDPGVAVTVTGSPTGNNFFRIDGPNIGGPGVNRVETDLFNISGRVYTDPIPSVLNVDRVTYARDSASGQIDIFVTALTGSVPVISGTGIPTTPMTQEVPNTGKFFAHIPVAAPASLPTEITLTNNLDTPPSIWPLHPVDELTGVQADYNPTTNALTVRGFSRDQLAPLATLTASSLAAPNTLDAGGTLVKTLTTIPPDSVTVTSSKGGAMTVPVRVLVPAPVAHDDLALVSAGNSVVVPLLANDSATAPATLEPATVTIVSQPSRGGVVIDPTTGAATYTPTGLNAGTDSFTYTVADSAQRVSNIAAVTVAVLGRTVAPVAVNDTASAATGSAVTIPVIANDTSAVSSIDPTSLILTTPSGGSAVANANGTVTYTAPATPGTYTFAYTVKDQAAPPATSNPAIVTVTVTVPNTPPVAVNDAASTTVGSAVVISVLANDTSATSPINPASVVVGTATGGTAVADGTGKVTYTPPAQAGIYSFTYTVKNTGVPPVASNAATVTVTVAAANVPPTAANDSAAVLSGGTITIPVLANDSSATSSLNPASIVVGAATGGSAVANANGTVTYTAPAVGGSYSFTYTVKDNATPPATSNVATVTVTVTALVIPPVANNDTAAAGTGQTVAINVLANDSSLVSTLNPATVAVGTPSGGTAVANPATGVVSYTAPGVAGTYTFTYTVQDNSATPATSNAATVTVTVTAPLVAPTAVNDTATPLVGGAGANRIVTVLANDSAVAPATLNAASVTVVSQPANGSAIANANGTITYTPAAGFVGTNTFTYTVRDSLGLVSNPATVTVNVTAPVTEALTVTLAQFILAGSEWRVEGTTTARTAGETISIYNSSTVPANGTDGLLGNATVTNGVWKFSLKPGAAPNALRRISIKSSLTPPAQLQGITLVVR